MQDKQCRATLDYEGLLVQLLNDIFKKINYCFLQTFKNNFVLLCVVQYNDPEIYTQNQSIGSNTKNFF